MLFKRVMFATLVVAVSAVAPGVRAQAPDISGTCADNFDSGTPCQGPDANPRANGCTINTWVVKATCELTVPGGVPGFWGVGVSWVYAESDQVATYDIKLIVPSTGEVIGSIHDDQGSGPGVFCAEITCVSGVPWNAQGGDGYASTPPSRTTDTVLCEIDSTWTKYGAPFAPLAEASAAAAAESPSPSTPVLQAPANNYFSCTVYGV